MVSYYEGSIEPIEYMAASFTDSEYAGFLKGNIIKYISRAGKKGPAIEDLRKAEQYLRWLIELETPDASDIASMSLIERIKLEEAKAVEAKHAEWLRFRDERSWT